MVYAYIDEERRKIGADHLDFLTPNQVWDCIEPGVDRACIKIQHVKEVEEMEQKHVGQKHPSTSMMNFCLWTFDEMFPMLTARALRAVVKKHSGRKGGFLCASEELANDACLEGSGGGLAWVDTPRLERANARIPMNDDLLFRSGEEMEACRALLLNKFPKLWASQIDAIVKETNHSYFAAALQVSEEPNPNPNPGLSP